MGFYYFVNYSKFWSLFLCTISDKRKQIGTNDVFYGKYELDKKKSRLTFGSFYATCLCHPTLISACHESHKRNRSASASFGPLYIVFIILNHLYKGHCWINCMHTQHLLYLFGVSIALSLVKINKIYVKFLCKIPYKTICFMQNETTIRNEWSFRGYCLL